MKYGELVIQIFGKIIEKYNLRAIIISDNIVDLISRKYILEFWFHNAEDGMVYIERRENGELYEYRNLDSFISASISEKDRTEIKTQLQHDQQIPRGLEFIAYAMESKWGNLLSGDKNWIEEYDKFILSAPPRNVTELRKKRYNIEEVSKF